MGINKVVSSFAEAVADIPDGAPENVVRIVTENCQVLKFKASGFEQT